MSGVSDENKEAHNELVAAVKESNPDFTEQQPGELRIPFLTRLVEHAEQIAGEEWNKLSATATTYYEEVREELGFGNEDEGEDEGEDGGEDEGEDGGGDEDKENENKPK
jgi:hypothetical protein